MWQISTEFWKRAVMSKMSRILIAMIRFYRKYISPMKRDAVFIFRPVRSMQLKLL